jgi:hypothetical protein
VNTDMTHAAIGHVITLQSGSNRTHWVVVAAEGDLSDALHCADKAVSMAAATGSTGATYVYDKGEADEYAMASVRNTRALAKAVGNSAATGSHVTERASESVKAHWPDIVKRNPVGGPTWNATCSCGWHGPKRNASMAAMVDANDHVTHAKHIDEVSK